MFDWNSFKNTPNAEAFTKKLYLSVARKMIREYTEGKNGTQMEDLNSLEAVIARALTFTKSEIKDWLETRDWSRVTDVPDLAKWRPILEENLPYLATRENKFGAKFSRNIADKVIAKLADDMDPIADFLFSNLTAPPPQMPEDF